MGVADCCQTLRGAVAPHLEVQVCITEMQVQLLVGGAGRLAPSLCTTSKNPQPVAGNLQTLLIPIGNKLWDIELFGSRRELRRHVCPSSRLLLC